MLGIQQTSGALRNAPRQRSGLLLTNQLCANHRSHVRDRHVCSSHHNTTEKLGPAIYFRLPPPLWTRHSSPVSAALAARPHPKRRPFPPSCHQRAVIFHGGVGWQIFKKKRKKSCRSKKKVIKDMATLVIFLIGKSSISITLAGSHHSGICVKQTRVYKTAGVAFNNFSSPSTPSPTIHIQFPSPPEVAAEKTCLNQNMMSLQLSCD